MRIVEVLGARPAQVAVVMLCNHNLHAQGKNMQFNLTFDASVPAEATAVVNAVAHFFEVHFTDTVQVNLNVAFGDLGANGLGRSNFPLNSKSYSDWTGALSTDDALTTDDINSAATLPSTDPISGTHTYWLTRAEQKAVGLLGADDAGNDGTVTFSDLANRFDYDRTDGITAGLYDFAGTVAHELTEIMGRSLHVGEDIGSTSNSYYPLDLFHYSAANTRSFTGTAAGYFSFDNGATNLADFNTTAGGDFGDWAGTVGNDSYLAFSSPGVVNPVTGVDFRIMDILGWDLFNTAPTAAPLADSVNEDGPSYTKDLLTGTSDAENDYLVVQQLDPSVSTAEGRTLNLGSDYTLAGSTISLTPAGFAKFNSLSLGESDSATFHYKVSDFEAAVSSTLTLTVNGLNDAPVIQSGGGGDIATYVVRKKDIDQAITKVAAIDVDHGTTLHYAITGGPDAGAFTIDPNSGTLAFAATKQQPHNSYTVVVQASDGSSTNATDSQIITVRVAADKMEGDAAHSVSDTFVFHQKFAANEVQNFDVFHDFLQFDRGMFSQDTGAAVLAAAQEKSGDLIITDLQHDRLVLDGVTKAALASHVGDIVFV
jgi:hypothetical protein